MRKHKRKMNHGYMCCLYLIGNSCYTCFLFCMEESKAWMSRFLWQLSQLSSLVTERSVISYDGSFFPMYNNIGVFKKKWDR